MVIDHTRTCQGHTNCVKQWTLKPAGAPPRVNAIAVITAGPGCPCCAGVPGDGGLRLTNEPADAVIRSCSVRPDGRHSGWQPAEPTLDAGRDRTVQLTLICDRPRRPGRGRLVTSQPRRPGRRGAAPSEKT